MEKYTVEGTSICRGLLDDNYIWYICGTLLYRYNRASKTWQVVSLLSDYSQSDFQCSFSVKKWKDSIIIASETKPHFYIVNNKRRIKKVDYTGHFQNSQDFFFVDSFENRVLVLLATQEAKALVMTGNLDIVFDKKIKLTDEKEHIQWLGSYIDKDYLFLILNSKTGSRIFIIDLKQKEHKQMSLSGVKQKIHGIIYDGKYLWIQCFDKGNNTLIQYDVDIDEITNRIYLNKGFYKRCHLRVYQDYVGIFSNYGCGGFFDKKNNKMLQTYREPMIPLDISAFSSTGEILVKNKSSLQVIDVISSKVINEISIPSNMELQAYISGIANGN